MAIVTGVATATVINADDVNQIPGNLHYAKVCLMGIACGTAVEKEFLAALSMRHASRRAAQPLMASSCHRFPVDGQGV